MASVAILTSPIVARLQSNKVPFGNKVAELLFRPNSVMRFSVLFKYLSGVLVMSVGVHQLMFPFQYSAICVLGVPPLTISVISPNFFVSHSALNPGNRLFPV